MANCEDKPCCVHGTEPCEPQWYDMPGAFDTSRPGNEHALCEHEYGICDVEDYDDEEDCDPHNSICSNDDDECPTCADYWLDFHAEGMMEDAAMEFGLWGNDC